MKSKWVILASVLAIIISLMPVAAVSAVSPQLPHAFFGNITVNGALVPPGSTLEARGTGVLTGVPGNPIQITETGKYGVADILGQKLIVQGDIAPGAAISFYLNGTIRFDQTAQWQSGETTQLDLSVTTPTPVVLPHIFYGNVFINGKPAPAGTLIEGRGGNVQVGVAANPVTITEQGKYGIGVLHIDGALMVNGAYSNGIIPGTPIFFYVNDIFTGQYFPFHSGSTTHLDLYLNVPLVLNLGEGWNALSVPLSLDASCNTWGTFAARGDGLNLDPAGVNYYFDGANQLFGQLLSDYPLKPCDAVFVKMAAADIASYAVSTLPSTPAKRLYPGWNLIGLASYAVMAAASGLVSVYRVTGDLTGYSQVMSPPFNQSGWSYFRDGTDTPMMQPGKGYWVFMQNGGALGGFTFTP